MLRLICIVPLVFMLAACVSTKDQYFYVSEKVGGEKVIALVGARTPWVSEIESRLRASGFRIKRFAAVVQAHEKVSETRTETYNVAEARVILVLDGYAHNSAITRCFGGGFRFDYISAELIDARTNETLATYSNTGYSENCPPLSGTHFSDITEMVNTYF